MKKQLLLLLGCLASTLVATATTTSITDFSNFTTDPNAYFQGSWSDGNNGPGLGLTQFPTYLTITGVSSTSDDGVDYYFGNGTATIDYSSYGLLSLTAKLGAGNTATQLVVDLLDPDLGYYEATFNLSSFNTSSFTTETAVLTNHTGNLASTAEFSVLGNDGVGSNLNISLDQLSAVTASAVPEPSTYAAVLGSVALAGAIYRTRRRRRVLRTA